MRKILVLSLSAFVLFCAFFHADIHHECHGGDCEVCAALLSEAQQEKQRTGGNIAAAVFCTFRQTFSPEDLLPVPETGPQPCVTGRLNI